VASYGHDRLSTFGVGGELGETEWRAVVRQLLAAGLLAVQGDHGTLALTDLSAEVLRGERQVMLRREAPRVVASGSSAGRGGRSARVGGSASGTEAVEGARSRSKRAGSGRITREDLPPEAEPVFERLRAWRTGVAKELGMPPYVIFHDATLAAIAAAPPSTLAELAVVNGVGETKLARYGQQILEVLTSEG
jgi:ATP-dependent DNA helicase RecQ